jgi:hypothetical protein
MTLSESQKIYYLSNKAKILAHNRLYYLQNKAKINAYNLQYQKSRYSTDEVYKLKRNLRRRFLLALKGVKKDKSAISLLGCSVEEFKTYLESKFQDGMTWMNHGEWHIDHIKPCISFDLTKPEERAVCFHYTNLQPLWAKDNLLKGGNSRVV